MLDAQCSMLNALGASLSLQLQSAILLLTQQAGISNAKEENNSR